MKSVMSDVTDSSAESSLHLSQADGAAFKRLGKRGLARPDHVI